MKSKNFKTLIINAYISGLESQGVKSESQKKEKAKSFFSSKHGYGCVPCVEFLAGEIIEAYEAGRKASETLISKIINAMNEAKVENYHQKPPLGSYSQKINPLGQPGQPIEYLSLDMKVKELGFVPVEPCETDEFLGSSEHLYTHPKLAKAYFDFRHTENDYISIMSTAFATCIGQTEESVKERIKQSFREVAKIKGEC